MTEKISTEIVSLDGLSGMLALTTRRVHQLTQEGIIIRVERGKYDLKRSVRGYLKYLNRLVADADVDGVTKDAKIEAAAQRLNYIREKSKLTRLKRIDRESLLVNKEEERRTAVVCTRVLRRLALEIPHRVSAKYAAEGDSDKIYRSLEKEFVEILTTVADFAGSESQEKKFTICGGEDCLHWAGKRSWP